MSDPIADLLTRLRNAIALNQGKITVPHSKLRQSFAEVLKEQGYIGQVKAGKGDKPHLELTFLSADNPSLKPLKGMRKISKPGRRVYVKSHEIPVVRQGTGIAIVSTPQGLMAGHKAKARKLGGELICEVW